MQELNVERIKAGDEEELRQLFQILLPRIRLWARRSSFPAGELDVDDVLNEAIYKIYSNLHKFDPERGALLPWCYAITRNVMLDTWRKRYREAKREVNIDDVEEEKLPTTETEEKIDSARVLEEAIQLLPEDQKTIVLKRIAGKTLRQIAEELGMSAPAAQRHYKLALKTLNTLILPSKAASKEVG